MTQVEHRVLPKQAEFMASREPAVLYSGAWRAGKSRALCYKLLQRASVPGAVEGLCRKHLVTLKATTLQTLLRPDGDLPPVLPEGSYTHRKADKEIEIHGGGRIVYFGFGEGEAGSQKVGSHGFTGCAVDEAVELTQENWTWCESRLSVDVPGLSRQIYAACNPGVPSHFLAEKFGLALDYKPDPGCHAIMTETKDNPFLPDDYIERISHMTGVVFKRYVKGLWVGSEGLVYDRWDRSVFVMPRRGVQWKRYMVGMDAGYENPTVMLVIGEDGDGNLHILHEFYKSKQLEPDVIREAERIERAYGIETFILDPSAASLGAGMRGAGLQVKGANNAVLDGIQSVQARLIVSDNGQPRLTVEPTCENTIREFESYERRKDTRTGGVYGRASKKKRPRDGRAPLCCC